MDTNCGTCRHFHRHQDGHPDGTCHAHPPTVLIVGALKHPITGALIPQTNGFWIPTSEAEVCGEHAPGEARVRPPIATAEEVMTALAGVEVEGSA